MFNSRRLREIGEFSMMEEDEDEEGSGWFEVKKKHRASSKLSIQKVSAGPSNRTQTLSSGYQALANDKDRGMQNQRQFHTHSKGSIDLSSPTSIEGDQTMAYLDKLVMNKESDPLNSLLSTSVKEVQPEAGTNLSQLVFPEGNITERDSARSAKTDHCSTGNGKIQDDGDPIESIVTSEAVRQFSDDILTENNDESARMENVVVEKESDSNSRVTKHSLILPVGGNERTSLQGSHDRYLNGTLSISEIPASDVNAGMNVEPDTILSPNGARRAVDLQVTSSIEAQREMPDASMDGADLGEGEVDESKERFRERLWCFLFENLNRAVDELYLLCELECDTGQMNEAILVLEEAGSDFRELKSRVEHFESTKRSSTLSPKGGTLVNSKTDHCRPHALSWEVRRMTTSPHRAEILSSSLEAFKKIQQERSRKHVTHDTNDLDFSRSTRQLVSRVSQRPGDLPPNPKERGNKSERSSRVLVHDLGNTMVDKTNKASLVQTGRLHPSNQFASTSGKYKKGSLEPTPEVEKQVHRKDKLSSESRVEKNPKDIEMVKKYSSLVDKEEKGKEKRGTTPWKSMDAWKEKRNWEDILKSPLRSSSRVSHSPGLHRKGVDRARVLHDKLMSPEKKKKSALDMKREAEEKHARATRIRSQLENERVQRLQRTSEKLNRVNELQAVRSLKLREGMHARHQRSETRHEAYLAQVARRAGDESSKVNEVRFITSLNEENKKLILRQKLHDSEMRRAEKLQVIRTKQKEDIAREGAVLERRKLLETEKVQRLAEIQRKKEEAQIRREEERKASSAAREAKAVEQLRKKEERAKAQQEESELLAQRLAEKLSESEQRRKYYLEQIREKASMDFRDQSSPLLRRPVNKDIQSRPVTTSGVEDYIPSLGDPAAVGLVNATQQHPLKRRIKKIRQRLMTLKYELIEPPVGAENTGIGYRALVGAARAKIGRWIQELQKFRQARKEGAASIGLIVSDMVKFLEGKDPELHASRHAGLLDFISSALPASHTLKPEACQVTVYLLRLLRVGLSVPVNRSYFLAQNLLPPIIPMLSAFLENYIKIVASSNPGSASLLPAKTSADNLEPIAEALDGFLWAVTAIMGHVNSDERQLQMQDGLMDLIVAYQVIHHLRDLFALYDRPQVEGSPFPSSILLSLNLLSVLTSRPGAISPIDWESCVSKEPSHILEEPTNVSGGCTLPDTEDLPANESSEIVGKEKLLSDKACLLVIKENLPQNDGFGKDSSSSPNGLENCEAALTVFTGSASGESQNIMLEEHTKSLLIQKEGKNSIGSSAERKTRNEVTVHGNSEKRKESNLKQPMIYLVSAVTETGLVSLPSLLTGVLLQANNRLSSEQASYILPSNFEEVSTGVLKVLNNLAVLDITLLQSMLARSDLKMEFFHLMSFLLSHCSSKWKSTNDQVGLLLLECLLLLGYFALFHPGNQAVLRWGKTPTILHKVCDLPFMFFSDPELTPILAGTLVAACFGCEQNKGVVEQELNPEMLLSLLKSCRLATQPDPSPAEASMAPDPSDANRTLQVRVSRKRISFGRGFATGSTSGSRTKTQKDSRGTRTCEDWAIKHGLPSYQASFKFMLHCRFPSTFLDRAEEFFSAEASSLQA